MSANLLAEGSVMLRLDRSVADAMRHRGLLPVLAAVLRAWWAQRPSRYSDVPAYLRDDVGLPAEEQPGYLAVGIDVWRLHPPERRWP